MFSSDEEDDIELINTNSFRSLSSEGFYPTMGSITTATTTNSSQPPVIMSNSERESDGEIPIYTSPILSEKKTKPYYWIITAFAAIGGFLFGYDTGIMSGAMLLLKDRFQLSSFWQELIISITIGAAAVSAFFGGFLNDKFGRKFVTIFGSVVFTCGAIILGFSQSKEMLLVGRFILGIAIGLSSMTIPMYIAECTPSNLRGRLVTLNLLFVTGGQCFASIMAGAFSYNENGWRFMLGLAAVPALVQLVGIIFLPESPRWLMKKGKEEKARLVLMKLKGITSVDQEFAKIKRECEAEENRSIGSYELFNIIRILKTPTVRRAVVVGCALQLFQQLSGINTVMYYSATVIKMSGVQNAQKAIWLSAVTAFVNFSFTIVGLCLVERIGRKKLIMSSLTGVTFSLILMAVTFQLIAANSPDITHNSTANSSVCSSYSSCDTCTNDFDCGFCYTGSVGSINGTCLPVDTHDHDFSKAGACKSPHIPSQVNWAFDYCPTKYSWMAVLGLVLYLMFFAPGMGPMPWAINSEIYPLWARSTGNSLSTATNWSCNLLVSMTFLTLSETITKYGTYWLFVGVCVIALVFFAIYLPETKGVTLEDVDELFAHEWCQCCGKGSRRQAYKPLEPPISS